MVFIKQQNNVRSGTMIYYFLKIINIVLPFLSQGLIYHHIHQWGCLAQTCGVQSDADSPEKSTWRNKHFKIQNSKLFNLPLILHVHDCTFIYSSTCMTSATFKTRVFIETFVSPCSCHFLDEDLCFLSEYWVQMNLNELGSWYLVKAKWFQEYIARNF